MPDTTHKPVILLAFANDRDDTIGHLRNLPVEARQLREVLEPAEQAGLCEVVVRSNSTASDLFKVFQDPRYRNRIAIFHYGGHANGYQLLLETAAGQAAAADAGGLAAFLAQQHGLQLVFLNGCSTQQQTQGLLDANISAVISTSRSIDDQVATDFAFHFYQGLAGGATIRTAYHEAAAAVQTAKGGNTRGLYFGTKADSQSHPEADRWPWNLYLREGSESADQWNLPEAVNDPLFGLPPLLARDLPESPYRHLNWFTQKDAEMFFGRGHQIRELYDRLTAPRTAPIILFYGQSGVGKSSILDAGLIPRLEQAYEVCYVRRGEGGLLDALKRAFLPEVAGLPIEAAWRVKEEQLHKPLILFLDQVEELYTRPLVDVPDEFEQLLKVVKAIFSDPNHRPQGKLVLGFRKEWLAELEAQLVAYELPRTKVFLEPLDRRGIIEVVQGPSKSKRLVAKYGLTVEDGLAEIIADELLSDRDSAIAPTLQILLTKMWAKATEANYEHPRFSQELYQQLKRDGILLRDFLNQQIAAFRQKYPEAVDSGLLLDIVALHTTPLGTADQRTVEQLQQQYAHLGVTLPAILQQCQDLHLLTVAVSAQKENSKTTRLAHDTLAPLVREQFDISDKPGQRAHRILKNRSVDWVGDQVGTPLDEADLKLVEQGMAGTHALTSTEQRLFDASRELATRLQRTRQILRVVGAVAVALIAGLGALNWWSHIQHERAQRKSLTFALDTIDNYYKRVSDETLLNQPGMQTLRKELLADAIENYKIILADRGQQSSDPAVQQELAETYFRAGRVARLVDSPQAAVEYLTLALDIQIPWQELDPTDVQRLRQLGKTWTELGTARYQIAKRGTALDWDPTLDAYQHAVELRRQIVPLDQNSGESQRLLANALMNLGNTRHEARVFEEAEKLLTEAEGIRLTQLKRPDLAAETKIHLRRDLAQGHYNLSRLFNDQAKVLARQAEALTTKKDMLAAEKAFQRSDQKFDSAEAQVGEAIRLLTELVTSDPQLENEFLLANSYHLLGELLSQFPEDAEKSRTALREAEQRIATLVRGNPMVSTYRQQLTETQKLLHSLKRTDPK